MLDRGSNLLAPAQAEQRRRIDEGDEHHKGHQGDDRSTGNIKAGEDECDNEDTECEHEALKNPQAALVVTFDPHPTIFAHRKPFR